MAAIENRRAGAIILAAGYSRRMGNFKPLMKVGGECLVDRLIEEFHQSGVYPAVITGYRGKLLENHIGSRAVCVYNERFDEGMFTSIQAGIIYFSDTDAEGVFLLPADYPLISREHISYMYLSACKNRDKFIVACYMGRKGHPLWIPKKYFREIALYNGEGGIKPVIDRYDYSGSLIRLEMPDDAVILDMNTPEAYRNILDHESEQEAFDFSGRIFFVNADNPDLDEKSALSGPRSQRAQALTVLKKPWEYRFNDAVIYSSDAKRARSISDILADNLKASGMEAEVPVIILPEFRDISLGEWDGMPPDELKRIHPEEYSLMVKNPLIHRAGGKGENFYDLQYRCSMKLLDIIKKYCRAGQNKRDIIVVTHRRNIIVMMCAVYGIELKDHLFACKKGFSVIDVDFGGE